MSTVSSRVTVTLQPNSSLIYSGEKITVRCEIQGGGDTLWTYEWRTPSSNNPPSHSEYTISKAALSHSGDYSCRGSRDYYLTEWSRVMRLTVSCKNSDTNLYDFYLIFINVVCILYCVFLLTVSSRVTVTLQPNWSVIYSGEKITVRCEIQGGGDTEWTYEWSTPSSNNPPSHSEYTISKAALSHSGDYSCRGRRDYYLTEWSRVMRLTVSYVRPSASLTVSPDRVQHFTSDSVSLSCEGNSTEWRVMRFAKGYYRSCSAWGRMTGSTCDIDSNWPSNAVYWCESGSGEFSNTVNITLQNYYGIILLSPVRPVTEGESVTLGCKLRTERNISSVFFYQNDKLIQNDSRVELNISAVSQSDEGFYKCQSSGKVSAQSWMSVKGEYD
uniref:Ig-like domain-containing protein n=1 Tax=Seriola lalandi dorsalis TaxID=1841481 RepID=A0A3B4YN47_SERLL